MVGPVRVVAGSAGIDSSMQMFIPENQLDFLVALEAEFRLLPL
jgi:hypothetical protein